LIAALTIGLGIARTDERIPIDMIEIAKLIRFFTLFELDLITEDYNI
jgi:hypothetical protein